MKATPKTYNFEMLLLGFLLGVILTICFTTIFRIERENVSKASEHFKEAVKEISIFNKK